MGLSVTNIYRFPGSKHIKMKVQDIKKFTNQILADNNNPNQIVAGDINGEAWDWSPYQNYIGNIIQPIIKDKEYTVENTGEIARVPDSILNKESAIDITLTKNLKGLKVHTWDPLLETR